MTRGAARSPRDSDDSTASPGTAPSAEVDRRTFLQRAGLGTAAAVAAPTLFALGCSSTSSGSSSSPTTGASGPGGTAAGTTPGSIASAAARGGLLLDIPAARSPVKHVVILMMENRSFDHWMGWMAKDQAYLDAGRRLYGGDFAIDGNQSQTFKGPTGDVTTTHMLELLKDGNPYRGCDHPDPGHGWKSGRAQRDGGFLAPGSTNDVFATGYYLADDLPFSSQLAKRFTICDRSFASLLGPTYPNREYLLSAQSGGNKSNALPKTADGFNWETILDRLTKAGVSTKCYYTDLPVGALFGSRALPLQHKIEDFFTDCQNGDLPSVSFVDPAFTTGFRTDNHPHGDIRDGEKFQRDVFKAFAASPNWENGVFLLTYDEWGGFFDHVKPPIFADDHAGPDDDNFAQGGFRVPTIVASPFAQAGFVDHTQYDHTSILRFLEWRFLGAPAQGTGGASDWNLTMRDRNANNIGTALVVQPDPELRFDVDVKLDPGSPDCAPEPPKDGATTTVAPTSAPTAAPASVSGALGDKHSFEVARDEGFFEMVGVRDVAPSPMVRDWVS